MIRRPAGDDFLLITQTDHALLSQQLAARFGNRKFATAGETAVNAIGLHDAGWPLHDDQPLLNQRGLPLDVFEMPRDLSMPIWAASAERAADADAYAGLLVSLHSLSLSIHSTPRPPQKTDAFDVRHMHEQFAINKFQHREVERQEQLRASLGFSTEIPLKHGLAESGSSAQEDRLLFDFRLLQAMDLLSLGLCCSKLPANETRELLRKPGANPVRLKLFKTVAGVMNVDPWPFESRTIELQVRCRRVPAKVFESVEAFQLRYRNVEGEMLTVRLKG